MLRIPIKVTARKLPHAGGRGSGPQGRINKMRKLVTALIRHERIEGQYQWVDEARGYAERVSKKCAEYWLNDSVDGIIACDVIDVNVL